MSNLEAIRFAIASACGLFAGLAVMFGAICLIAHYPWAAIPLAFVFVTAILFPLFKFG